MKDCGKRGHARRGCKCERCVRVRKRETDYTRKHREKNPDMYRKSRERAWERAKKDPANNPWRRYEKTPKGFLVRAYRNMQSRVEGIQRDGSWVGKELLPREDFYAWAFDSPEFWRLFKRYVESGYEMRLAPSVNRINPERGYTLDNIEWVTHGVNSALAASSRSRPVRKALEEVAELVSETSPVRS